MTKLRTQALRAARIFAISFLASVAMTGIDRAAITAAIIAGANAGFHAIVGEKDASTVAGVIKTAEQVTKDSPSV